MAIGRPQTTHKSDIASLPSTTALRRERIYLVTDAGSGMLAYWDGSAWVYFGKILEDADGDTKIQVEESADEDKIRFDTGGTERAIIDSTGLGIGTSSPTYLLDVYTASGNAVGRLESAGTNSLAILRFQNDAQTWWSGVAGNDQFRIVDVTGGSTVPFLIAAGAATNALTIDSSGRVGVGTSSPDTELSVNGDSTGTVNLVRAAISSNSIALPTHTYPGVWEVEIDSSGGAATLNTITGLVEGDRALVRISVAATITMAHLGGGTGQLYNAGAANFDLTSNVHSVEYFARTSAVWAEAGSHP